MALGTAGTTAAAGAAHAGAWDFGYAVVVVNAAGTRDCVGMTEPASDLLEAWKAGFDATGAGSIEQLTQLAHLSRFIADYGDRSADAHLVLFALTRNPGYLVRAIQVGTPSASGELYERAASLIPGALDRAPVPGRWRGELMRARATICYSQAAQSDQLSDYAAARTALEELVQVLARDDPQLMPTAASLANVIREIARRGGDATIGDALSCFERALALGRPDGEHYDAVLLDTARTAAEMGRTDRALELYAQASNREIACQDVRTCGCRKRHPCSSSRASGSRLPLG